MFHTGTYNLPFRILKEIEVIQLSGLKDFWNNVSLTDVELVPETLLRNMCGNCFHPDLISSALGSNTFLKSWAKGEAEGSSKLVMNQAEAYAVFSELCGQIEKEAKNGSARSSNSIRHFLLMKYWKTHVLPLQYRIANTLGTMRTTSLDSLT